MVRLLVCIWAFAYAMAGVCSPDAKKMIFDETPEQKAER